MVAALMDRGMFSCAACAKDKSGDLQASNSGKRDSCEGPREWAFHQRFTWRGCPRTALHPTFDAWIDFHARTGGKLDARAYVRAPALLLEVLRCLDVAADLREAERIRQVAPRRPVVLPDAPL